MPQNIHLVARWLSILDKKVERYSSGSHEDYRVFISAEPAPSAETHIIPQGILENAIKITNEPPTGMYANLHKALDLFTQVGRVTTHSQAKETQVQQAKMSLLSPRDSSMLASHPHKHTSTLMSHQNVKGQTHHRPLASITALSVGRGACHYCGGPVPSWVTALPHPPPPPWKYEDYLGHQGLLLGAMDDRQVVMLSPPELQLHDHMSSDTALNKAVM